MAAPLKPIRPVVPRLALSVEEACASLGVSWDFWAEHIAPELRIVRRGRRKLIAVGELQRWLDANGATVLGDRVTPIKPAQRRKTAASSLDAERASAGHRQPLLER